MIPAETRLVAPDDTVPQAREHEIGNFLARFGLEQEDVGALLEGLTTRLRQAGLALRRMMIGSDYLHPVIGGINYLWRPEAGVEESVWERTFDVESSDSWLRSPFFALVESKAGELRRRLDRGYRRGEFPLLDELQDQGCTDYIAFASSFAERARLGEVEEVFCSFQTDRQGGFTDGEVEFLRRLMPLLALTYKAIITVRTARALMTTYLGKDAGERVIAGSIDRGRAVRVPAVLWYSDLQGFTKIADAVDGPVLLALLNDYAEAVVAAVQQHEGEVLKFMGDGVFAMFPRDGGGTETLCQRAIDAAVSLRDAVAALNERRSQAGLPTCGFYVALHYGEVLYGNIGSPARLDFTVVGPAVNETARIEAMCRSLDQWLVVSSAFAEAAGRDRHRLVSLGRYALRGVRRPQELFTIDPEG
jgi:adenylate cyclase